MAETNHKVQVEFYIAQGDSNLGPWTINEIASRISRSEISVTDFVFDEVRQDWIPLMECEALKDLLRKSKPKAPPPRRGASEELQVVPPQATQQQSPSLQAAQSPARGIAEPQAVAAPRVEQPVSEWFVQKGAVRHGPMTYLGLVRALQDKSVYDFDFAWKAGMDNWVRIAELEQFNPQRIRELAKNSSMQNSEEAQVFFRREYPRLTFESEVIVHDDQSVWMGQAFEAGMGGSGVVIENSTLNPGQVVRLHFAPCDGLPAFNALGEIVGKKYSGEVRGAKSPVRYAVRFLKLDGSAEQQVREYFAAKN